MYAPVVLFVYNRINHVKEVINALSNNLESIDTDLYIFSDGPKNDSDETKINNLRNYLKTIIGFKSVKVVENENNLGLTNSIISGLNTIFKSHENVIVLEDDILTSRFFLKYMNSALVLYSNEKKVGSISGYRYPPILQSRFNFFIKGGDCWGWATWKDRWDDFSLDIDYRSNMTNFYIKMHFNYLYSYKFTEILSKSYLEKKTWAIRWHCHLYFNNQLTLYPHKTLVNNIGNDGSGTNCELNNSFNSMIDDNSSELVKIDITNSFIGYLDFVFFFIYLRIKNQFSKIKRILK